MKQFMILASLTFCYLVEAFWPKTTHEAPYSPDLPPVTFSCSHNCRDPIKRWIFVTVEKIKTASLEELKLILFKALEEVYYI